MPLSGHKNFFSRFAIYLLITSNNNNYKKLKNNGR